MTPEVQERLSMFATAERIQWDETMMLFHPLLGDGQYNGFYPTPEDLSEALEGVDCDPKHKIWGFATVAEGCQSLTVTDLIENASGDMFEDWYEQVTGDYEDAIGVIQAALDTLREKMSASHPCWRVDFSRVVLLPVGVTVAIGQACCLSCLGPDRPGMTVCSVCGNKRCPKATHHDCECTGSNETGQAGSIYV